MTESVDLTNEEIEAAIAAGEKAKALKSERELPLLLERQRVAAERELVRKRRSLENAAGNLRLEKNNVYVSTIEAEDASDESDGTILAVNRIGNEEYEFSIFKNELYSSFEYVAGFQGTADEMRERFKGLLDSIK